ncbi:MAG TPA: Dabb family protein [Blastocatellia bacterium]|nr:Dabb family protein [Blastocatellia bacterium]
MVEHILLMRWTDEASQEAIDNALTELRGLKDKIAGIVDMSCGANFSERAKGYTHGMVMRFADRLALEAYFPHPEHQRVVQNFINPIRADTLILDYENLNQIRRVKDVESGHK